MGKINSTLVVFYADGVAIALQRGLSISVDADLPDTTNKESGGWAEHMLGLRNTSLDFDGLFSTTGLSAADLLVYITSRTSLLMSIVGGITYPILGKVDINSIKLNASHEQPFALNGSMKVNGALFQLKGNNANLITDPDAGGKDYETFDLSGITITSAINAGGSAYANSNTINITSGDIIKVAVFLILNTGEAPTVGIWDNTSAYISNQVQLVAGLNIITLTTTGTDASSSLRLSNTGAANWSLTPLYAFKDNG